MSECSISPGSVNLRIHGNDEMYLRELAEAAGNKDLATWRYLRTGEQIARAVDRFMEWKFGGLDKVTSLLDFACGYGRVTRFLAARVPIDRIWVSDIYPEAVSFQKQQFGVNGFVSVADPAELQVCRTFDCVLAVSLFSHLPADLFEAWLARLAGLLNENGVLMFSVHDASLLPGLCLNEAGFRFLEESESRTLSKQQYGTMYVDEGFVRRAAGSAKPGHELWRIPRALGSFQDVYLLSGTAGPSFKPLQYDYGPIGAVETVEIRGNRLEITGRAADLTEGSEVLISVLLNGRTIGQGRPETPRPDVVKWTGFQSALLSGFSLTMNLPRGYSGSDLLLVKACGSKGGNNYILHVGPLTDSAARFPAGQRDRLKTRLFPLSSNLKRLRMCWRRNDS
ncbi:MAG: trans-aconitate 2-methyltransferase [Acidobacteriota bacterium]